MKRLLGIALLLIALGKTNAQTIVTFHSTVGTWEVELFDDKPITVSNFLKYAASGRYDDQLIHRWVPGFVIQGGGYTREPVGTNDCAIDTVQSYGTIQNESKVGTFRSNAYGTIAMARLGTNVNSASSQWYINLTNNGGVPPNGLDHFAEGYTVFGRVISGTNVINKFFPPPPAHGIDILNHSIGPIAILETTNITCADLVTINLSIRRDMNLEVARSGSTTQIFWVSVRNVTNVVEVSTTLTNWTTLTNVFGAGRPTQVSDTANDAHRFYRVKLLY
ncbi:MAG TPA: peptidylprolyl isomerase [Verrucomicrobiae bacterium]